MKVLVRPDQELEAQIDVAHDRFVNAKSDRLRRKFWEELKALLAKRSPTKVRRMEREQGLDRRATFVPREGRPRS